jgi:hypothetical protein
VAERVVVLDVNLLGSVGFATADVASIAVTASAVIRVFMTMLLCNIGRRCMPAAIVHNLTILSGKIAHCNRYIFKW